MLVQLLNDWILPLQSFFLEDIPLDGVSGAGFVTRTNVSHVMRSAIAMELFE